MMGKNIIRLIATISTVLLLSNWALAGNNVNLQTDVPDIPKSDCDQAGNIVMLFESNAKMEEGDVVTFSLSNNVSVCKTIDFFLRIADQGSEVLQNDTSLPIYDTSDGTDNIFVQDNGVTYAGSSMSDNGVTFDVGFLVQASTGSQTITFTLGRRITSGTDAGKFYPGNWPSSVNGKFTILYSPNENDNTMVIRLFDQKTTDNFFYKDDTTLTGTQYTTKFDTTGADDDLNVLCINTSAFTGEYVLATPKSTVVDDSYKLSFSGDYYVAHITGSDSYSVTAACKDDCAELNIGTTTDQWGNVSTPAGVFDPGSYSTASATSGGSERWNSSGTCNSSDGNGVMLRRTASNFGTNDRFTVTAELYIDGVAANQNTIKWTTGFGGSAVYRGSFADSGKCSGSVSPWTAGGAGGWEWVDSSDETKIVQTITADSTAHDAFMVDLPTIDYTYTNLSANNEIQVKITFGKFPCGGGNTATICLAKVVSTCPSTASYQLTFPFATNKGNTSFWTGISVVNLESETTTISIALYDSAGGSGSLEDISMVARGQYLNTIQGIVETSGFKNGSTALDTSKDVFVVVTGTRSLDGLCFVGSMNGSQLHGYLPRVWKDGSVRH